MYFPNADVAIHPALLVFLGLIVGTLGGFFGVGGGFLITGGLLVFGVPPVYAVGTGLTLVMGTSLINTLKHRRFGNVDFKLGLLLVAGSVPALYGAQRLNQGLESAGLAGPVVRLVYVAVLLSLGSFIVWDHWRTRRQTEDQEQTALSGLARRLERWDIPPRSIGAPGLGRISTVVSLPLSNIERISAFVPLGIGAVVGFLSGILGAGGGFILTPALIYVLGVPTVVAIGTSLFQVIITGSVGAFVYAIADRVDPLMAVLMLAAASIGAQLGASATRLVEPARIRFLFGIIVLSGGAAVALEEASQALEGMEALSTAASVVLLGAGGGMCLLLLALLLRARRGGKGE